MPSPFHFGQGKAGVVETSPNPEGRKRATITNDIAQAIKREQDAEHVALDDYQQKHLEQVVMSCAEEEYFHKHRHSIRVDFPTAYSTGKYEFDPIDIMKDGVMVMYYDVEGASFIRKVLKVDDQLRFLYITDQTSKARGKVASPVIVLPLTHLKRVFAMDEALHVCEKNACSVDSFKMDSVFVIWIDANATTEQSKHETEEETPDIVGSNGERQLHIFTAAPEQQLRMCVQKCKDFNDGKSDDPNSLRKRVDKIQIQEYEQLLDKMCPDIKFDVSYRGEESLRTITLSTEKDASRQQEACFSEDMGGTNMKLAQEMLPSDYSRVHFVLQDAINLRRSITGLTADCFRRGLSRFIDEQPLDLPIPENMNLEEAKGEVDRLRRFLHTSSMGAPSCHYQEASSRAAVLALQHMLGTEKEFSSFSSQLGDPVTGQEIEDAEAERKDAVLQRGVTNSLSTTKWRCTHCSFINRNTDKVCAVCGANAPSAEAPSTAQATPVPSPKMLGNATDNCPQQ